MNPPTLPTLNAIGCLVLVGVVFSQWAKETRAEAEAGKLRVEIAMANDLAASEAKRALHLERDIAALRESLEAMREIDAVNLVKSGLRESLADARRQNESWKNSVVDRDNRIAQLEADLVATRRRLDEAIVRLRQTGTR